MDDQTIYHWVLLGLAAVIYFLPTMLASNRGHPNTTAIFILNLFLGWTLIGWVGALVWSAIAFERKAFERKPRQGIRQPNALDRFFGERALEEAPPLAWQEGENPYRDGTPLAAEWERLHTNRQSRTQ